LLGVSQGAKDILFLAGVWIEAVSAHDVGS
jgi:hypothetical protein